MTAAAPAVSIGIDVGGTKILGVALSATGQILATERQPTPKALDADLGRPAGSTVADAIAAVARTLAAAVDLDASACPVGVGIPGMVDRAGVVVDAPNLHGAIGANVAELVGSRLGRRSVAVDNDANCAAVAERHFGAARGVNDAIVVTLGTGIGGAAIVDGRLLRGANGFAGEFGHMVVDPAGPPCPCGSRGCFERYASGAGLRHLAAEAAASGALDHAFAEAPEELLAAAAAGDVACLSVVDRFCWWLARGLANLCAIFDPELVLLGGGVIEGKGVVLEPTRAYLATEIQGAPRRQPPRVEATAFGSEAGAIGAALLGETRR